MQINVYLKQRFQNSFGTFSDFPSLRDPRYVCMMGSQTEGEKGTVPEVVRVLRDQTKESLGLIAQNVVWPSRPFGFELQPFLGPHVLLLLLVLVYEEPLR